MPSSGGRERCDSLRLPHQTFGYRLRLHRTYRFAKRNVTHRSILDR